MAEFEGFSFEENDDLDFKKKIVSLSFFTDASQTYTGISTQ